MEKSDDFVDVNKTKTISVKLPEWWGEYRRRDQYNEDKRKEKTMERLRLLDGTEYTLAINGVAELGEKVQIKVVTEDSLDSIYEKFTAENTATMTVIGESFIQKLTGYTQMGSMVTRDTYALIEVKYPEASEEDDTPAEAEEVRGTIITFEMCKERIEDKVEQNRADIDYLLMMEEQA